MHTQKTFLLYIPILIWLMTTTGVSNAQVSLHDRTWDYTMAVMRKVDSLATTIENNRMRFKRKTSKLKAYCPEVKEINLERKTKFKRGHVVVHERYSIGIGGTIRVLRIDGQIMMLRSEFTREGYGSRVRSTFSYLGEHSWQWTYRTYEDGRPLLKSKSIYNWH